MPRSISFWLSASTPPFFFNNIKITPYSKAGRKINRNVDKKSLKWTPAMEVVLFNIIL